MIVSDLEEEVFMRVWGVGGGGITTTTTKTKNDEHYLSRTGITLPVGKQIRQKG